MSKTSIYQMAGFQSRKLLFLWIFLPSCMLCLSHGTTTRDFRIKAVNLGGWLVTEGWIKPSLFDGIPNNDFLDGNSLQFKSVRTGKYLSAKSGGVSILAADQIIVSKWELFRLWRINQSTFQFRVFNDQFVGLERAGKGTNVVAVSKTPGRFETLEIVRKPDDSSLVRIKAANGFFFQVNKENLVTADYAGKTRWGNNDPSVFKVTVNGTAHGEYRVTNGYGPKKAAQIMIKHWNTFIVEDDFKFIAENGLNAVRIPVGWWIAIDPTPPLPYVGGSLNALDNAFSWAHFSCRKYGLNVIIDLHAAPSSQNGYEHSSSRDGSIEWGKTDDTLKKTTAVIEFLTARYVNPSLCAVELINEPRAPMVPIQRLIEYYKAGYKAVRKHSSTVYVVLSNRLDTSEPAELVQLASGLKGSVIDIHYYSLFFDSFKNMTVKQNIDFIYTNRSTELNHVSNGPLTFVGEWTAEWEFKGGTKKDYKRFAKAQLQVYKRATFGWAYWTLKNVNKHWSLEWMIKNGYIKI